MDGMENQQSLSSLFDGKIVSGYSGRPGVVPREYDNIFSTFGNERLAKRGRHKSQLLVSLYKSHGQREALILYLSFNTHVHPGRLDHFRKLNR